MEAGGGAAADRTACRKHGKEHHAATGCGHLPGNGQRPCRLGREKPRTHPFDERQGVVVGETISRGVWGRGSALEKAVRRSRECRWNRILSDRTRRQRLLGDGNRGALSRGISEASRLRTKTWDDFREISTVRAARPVAAKPRREGPMFTATADLILPSTVTLPLPPPPRLPPSILGRPLDTCI